jgi:hypothetical protein
MCVLGRASLPLERTFVMRCWLVSLGLWLLVCPANGLWSVANSAEIGTAIPENASVIVRVKAPQTVINKFAEYANVVQQGFGDVVKGSVQNVPQLSGTDLTKDWWMIVFVESQTRPAVVFAVPATAPNQIKASLPPHFQFQAVEKLALFSDQEGPLVKVRDGMNGKGTAFWSQIDASSRKLFDDSDLSVLVNVKQLARSFDSELQQAEPKLNALLDQIANAMPEPQRAQFGSVLDIYRVLGKAVVQGARDARSMTLGIAVSKETIRIEQRLQVTDGTSTAKHFASQPTGKLSLMNRLPEQSLAYYGAKLNVAGLIEWSMSLTKSMLGNASAEQKETFDRLTKEMQTLMWNEMAGYINLDPSSAEGGVLRAGSVVEVTPTDRLREISRSMFKSMDAIQVQGFKQTTRLDLAAEKIAGAEVDRVTIQQEFDPNLDPLGIQRKFRDVLFGNQGMQQLVAYQQDRVLQMLGGGKEELERLVVSLDSTKTADASIAAARQRLYENANIVGLLDLARLIGAGVKVAASERVKLIPVDASVIDRLQLQPSFIGLAVACEPNAIQAQLDVPAVQVQGIARTIMQLMAFRGGPQP